eukprot:COSAG06_NODE_4799_length_3945_cov_8.420376_7_plen_209_part_00
MVAELFYNIIFGAVAGLMFSSIASLRVTREEYQKKIAELKATTLYPNQHTLHCQLAAVSSFYYCVCEKVLMLPRHDRISQERASVLTPTTTNCVLIQCLVCIHICMSRVLCTQEFSHSRDLTKPLQARLIAFNRFLYDKKTVFDEKAILSELPLHMRAEVVFAVYGDVIKDSFFFLGTLMLTSSHADAHAISRWRYHVVSRRRSRLCI